jgi:hypothetical protein
MAINEGASMAISEIMVKVEFTPRWYMKPVAMTMFSLHWAGIISSERAAEIIVGCFDCEVVK